MEKIIVHDFGSRNLGKEDNAHLKIGRTAGNEFVTSFSIQNQGRNSLLKLIKNGSEIRLRPWEPAFTIGVEWPCVLDFSLTIVFETENQQQYEADGTRAAVDEAETDITEPDCVFHNAALFELFAKPTC